MIENKEIDKYEDAVPFHNPDCKDRLITGIFCTCRWCRDWCPCMNWWRESEKEKKKEKDAL